MTALWLLWVLWAIASAAFVTLLGRETWREVRAVMRAWLGPVRWPRLRLVVRIPKRQAEQRRRLNAINGPWAGERKARVRA